MELNTHPPTPIYHRAKQCEAVIRHLYNEKQIVGRLTGLALGARFLSYDVRLKNPLDLKPAIDIAENMALMSGSPAVIAQRDAGIIRYDFELRRAHWQEYTRADVEGMQLGLAAGRKPVEFDFVEYHHLFAGATKSGKSTTMQSFLCGLAATYEPSDLELYICDPHGDYEGFVNLAHLGAPIATSHDEIHNLIRHVYKIFSQRKANKSRNERRVVFLIDESQDSVCLGSKAEGFNQEQVAMISSMSRQAGKFRVHLVMGSQKPSQTDMPGIVDNLLGRYVGRVQDAQVSANLTGQPGLGAHKLSGYGDFLKVTAGSVIRFQSAMPRPQDYDALPRAEIGAVEAAPVLDIDTGPGPGRPPEPLDPKVIAWMLFNKIPGRRTAERQIGLSRHMHSRSVDFCREFLAELKRLKTA